MLGGKHPSKVATSNVRRIRLALVAMAILLASVALVRSARSYRLHEDLNRKPGTTIRVRKAKYKLSTKMSMLQSGEDVSPVSDVPVDPTVKLTAEGTATLREAAELGAKLRVGSPEENIGAGTHEDEVHQQHPVLQQLFLPVNPDLKKTPDAQPQAGLKGQAGLSKPAEAPACKAFQRRPGIKTVAIVGNGPLSPEQREEIEDHCLVVRFNFLNNMLREEERIDIWAVRYSYDAPRTHYWGFDQMPDEQLQAMLSRTQGVWLITPETSTWAYQDALKEVPRLKYHDPALVATPHVDRDSLSPTTGFLGLQQVLRCASPNVKLHIYGMNWSANMWAGHDTAGEAAVVHLLVLQGRVVMHDPPCPNLRSCEDKELHVDCHLAADGRFVCPKPVDGAFSPDIASREYLAVDELLAGLRSEEQQQAQTALVLE